MPELNWLAWAGIIVLALYIINLRPRFVGSKLRRSPSSTRDNSLVVHVHGMMHHIQFRSVFEIAQSSRPDADHLVIRYDANPLSNAKPDRLAQLIEKRISDAVGTNGYSRIVLAGYSIGAPLVRRAFLINWNRRQVPGHTAWWDKVERIALAVGLNGGWNRDHIRGSGLAIDFAKFCGIAGLLAACERGQPFVENLRSDFIDFIRKSGSCPDIIQLVGISDTIVDADSDMDLQASPKTYFLGVDSTSHWNYGVVGRAQKDTDFRERSTRAQSLRAAAFAFIFGGDLSDPQRSNAPKWIVDQLGAPIADRSTWGDPRVQHVVMVLHGIRDHGHWAERFRLHIESVLNANGVAVVSPSFGRFSMVDFIFPVFKQRDRAVRWFARAYSEVIAKYPNVQAIDFIGHSYGTYVFANALAKYPAIRFRRAYLAGSVLPTRHNWQPLLDSGRVGALANATADSDLVVGIFPACYERMKRFLFPLSRQSVGGFLDLGDAGVRGFQCSDERVTRIDFLRGGHGAFNASFDYLDLASEYVVHGNGERFAEKLSALRDRGSLAARLSHATRAANTLSPLIWLVGLAGFLFLYDRAYVWLATHAPAWITASYPVVAQSLDGISIYPIGAALAFVLALFALAKF